MSVKLRTKNKRLYLDVYYNGTRKWEALKISLADDRETNKEILRIAEICRAKRELQILSGAWGITDPVGGKTGLVSYLEKIKGKSGKAAQAIISNTLVHLKNFPGGAVIQLKQITAAWVQKFQDYLKVKCGLKRSSAETYESVVRHAIKLAVKENLISLDPTTGIKKIKRNEPDKIFLNSNELQQLAGADLIAAHGYVIKRAFLFACNTGLRISDLVSLSWGSIEYKPLQVIKRQEKTEQKVFVPLNDNAWKIINDRQIHNHNEHIFPNLEKGIHTKYLKKWAKAAGVKKNIGWHTARHTFAVLSLESGADLYTVSKLLGHTDIKTTQVYAKATDKMKREAVNALPEIEVK
ncbi:MAG: site-specific integrase [Treponema sp.]|jgi:site-specific recombinase XerD|nr:site-specific integrase [Treponema sp.]